MTIHSADEALVIWGEYVITGGGPIGLVCPKGEEKPGPVHGLTEEQQVVALVKGTEGFEQVEGPLFGVYSMLTPRHLWGKGWEDRLADFCERLTERIGKGFTPAPPVPEWCPADEPKVTVTNEGKVVLK